MNSKNNHTDDFKKLFDVHQMPELPMNMEDKIMAGIEIQKLREKRSAPQWFSGNLVIFSISSMLLVLVSVFQFATEVQFPMLYDIKILLAGSTGISFILWLTEFAEGTLLTRFNRRVQSY